MAKPPNPQNLLPLKKTTYTVRTKSKVHASTVHCTTYKDHTIIHWNQLLNLDTLGSRKSLYLKTLFKKLYLTP